MSSDYFIISSHYLDLQEKPLLKTKSLGGRLRQKPVKPGYCDLETVEVGLALRLPPQKRRDKGCDMMYKRGHEINNQYQREALDP